MEEVVAQVLLASASLAAGFAIRSLRLSVATVGGLVAVAYVAQANTPGDVRWGLVALSLNVGAALFVLGYQRGIESRVNSASSM